MKIKNSTIMNDADVARAIYVYTVGTAKDHEHGRLIFLTLDRSINYQLIRDDQCVNCGEPRGSHGFGFCPSKKHLGFDHSMRFELGMNFNVECLKALIRLGQIEEINMFIDKILSTAKTIYEQRENIFSKEATT